MITRRGIVEDVVLLLFLNGVLLIMLQERYDFVLMPTGSIIGLAGASLLIHGIRLLRRQYRPRAIQKRCHPKARPPGTHE
ncbi:hypothetical protein [Arthrobacter monumenti]